MPSEEVKTSNCCQTACPPSLAVLTRWCGSDRNLSCDCQTISAQTRYYGLVKPSLLSEEHSLQGS